MDVDSRVRTLEVHVLGNGGPGLLKRMEATEMKTATQEDRIDRLEFTTAQSVSKAECVVSQRNIDKVVEEAIKKALIQKKNTGIHYFFEWVTKLGPTLAGIGAIIASIVALK